MKKRIAYISLYFFTVLLIFILQKPLFMLYNGSIEKGFGFADYMQVMIHGASLDAATAGYLTAFPFLLVLISIWFRKFPLKKHDVRRQKYSNFSRRQHGFYEDESKRVENSF